MLFLKALFITVLLFFGTAQCLTNDRDTGDLKFTQVNDEDIGNLKFTRVNDVNTGNLKLTEAFENIFGPSKELTTSELLNDLVKNREKNGLRDNKNSVIGLDMPGIKEVLEDAGEFVVIRLNMLTSDIQSIMENTEGTNATLYGYRVGSASDYNLENAARFFFLAMTIRAARYLVETTLFSRKFSFSRLLY